MRKLKVLLVLHNLRSAYNVGSIFRTAAAAGVSKIYLTGYTPSPLDRFGRINRTIAKTALGAERYVVWEKISKILPLLKKLKSEKFEIVAVEQSRQAVSHKKFRPKSRTVFIFGNEVTGLPAKILRASDRTIEILLRGKKESLNVAVAAGVILFNTL